ncbi:MAG: hypothetical protein H5U17_08800 [Defluviimonas sp.]|nr:hypothetical protein [Defluviimonas sp.]
MTTSTTANELEVQAATGNADPTLAYGLSGISDWGSNMVFLNLLESARGWQGRAPGVWSAKSYGDLIAEGVLDDQGWPTHIPDDLSAIGTIWDWGSSDAAAAASRAGTYVLEYEGEGTIKFNGNARIISQEPGRMVVELTGGTLHLNIVKTDPNGTGNYLRDISLVKAEYKDLYDAGAIFNPDYLAIIQDARQIRFMDWMGTNNSPVTDGDMPLISAEGFWGGSSAVSVPLEIQVALANQTGADPWFNIPHGASDDYIRAMAEYVRDHLDPNLTARVEYSNEVWNWSFKQTHWISQQVEENWGSNDYVGYHVKLATEAAVIWQDVFAETGSQDRLVNVLGAQASNNYLTGQLLGDKTWAKYEPDAWIDPKTVFEEVATTTYFGGSTLANAEQRAEMIEVLKDPSIDATAWLAGKLMDPDYGGSLPSKLAALQSQAEIIHEAGLKMVAYEGGQHVLHSFSVKISKEDLATLTEFFSDFVRSPEMADLYKALWDGWAEISDGPFMQFGDVGAASKYGAWGIYAHLQDNNPRAEMLEMLNATSTPWWTEATTDETYQQGLTVFGDTTDGTLIGTNKIDFLVGGGGNETFFGGKGNDGINGGDGGDALILSGAIDDYLIAAEGKGYRVTGIDGSKFVVNIETFNFDDVQGVTLEQMLDRPQAPVKEGALDPDLVSPVPPAPAPILEMAIKGEHLDFAARGATSLDLSAATEGVRVNGINTYSALGKEVGLSIFDETSSYVIAGKQSGTAEISGIQVSASYYTQQENLTKPGSALLDERALAASLKLGSVASHVEKLVLTSFSGNFLGRSRDDVVDGGDGGDYLGGGDGNDMLTGGAGSDSFCFERGCGKDKIRDFAADDLLYLGDFPGTGSFDAAAGETAKGVLILSNGTDSILFEGLSLNDLDWIRSTVQAASEPHYA